MGKLRRRYLEQLVLPVRVRWTPLCCFRLASVPSPEVRTEVRSYSVLKYPACLYWFRQVGLFSVNDALTKYGVACYSNCLGTDQVSPCACI